MKRILYHLAAPKHFYTFAGKVAPWCYGLATVGLLFGMLLALAVAPADYQQGDAYRIMFIHVPSAICSMAIYAWIAVSSAIFLIWRTKVSDLFAKAAVPIGATFTVFALVTGSLWGKPMWGTYWIWDARLTSELILLFLYFGLFALRRAIPNEQQAQTATAIMALLGALDLPIIHYSVNWWHSLHQPSTLLGWHKPTIAAAMLWPLVMMIIAFLLYAFAAIMSATRLFIFQREVASQWLAQEVNT